ncbi:centromere protein L-like isoform X2 [Linepithema humile]
MLRYKKREPIIFRYKQLQKIKVENAVGPRTSNVYTPRTPRMQQRQRFDITTRLEEDEEIENLGLEALVDQTWNIYAVSILFDFHHDDIHFKLYSKKLREEIARTLSREDVVYDANFSIMEDIISQPNQDTPTIKIQVLAKDSNHEEGAEKVIYKGYLLSWNIKRVKSNIQNSIKLPLLLCRGTRSCIDAVHTIISYMFDCLITTLSVDEEDLRWFIPIVIMTAKKKQSGEVQMEYIVPKLPVTDIIDTMTDTITNTITDTITVKWDILALKKILDTTRDQNDTSLDRQHIEMFYEILYSQMLNTAELQLGLCTLRRINLPGITIMENKIKIKNEEIMDQILLYLNEKALDRFHTSHIDDI